MVTDWRAGFVGASLAEHAAFWQDMDPHVGTLRDLAAEAHSVVEFGVRAGVSTWALLDGLPADGTLTSVDVERWPLPPRVTDDPRWTFIEGDDLTVPLPDADLVLIDTSHTYPQTLAELRRAVTLGVSVIALHDWSLEPVQSAVVRWMPDDWTITVHPSRWGLAVVRRLP